MKLENFIGTPDCLARIVGEEDECRNHFNAVIELEKELSDCEECAADTSKCIKDGTKDRCEKRNRALSMAIDALKAEKTFHIVTVNPDVNGGTMACSECGCEYLDWHIDKGEFKYCINCGARMECEEE